MNTKISSSRNFSLKKNRFNNILCFEPNFFYTKFTAELENFSDVKIRDFPPTLHPTSVYRRQFMRWTFPVVGTRSTRGTCAPNLNPAWMQCDSIFPKVETRVAPKIWWRGRPAQISNRRHTVTVTWRDTWPGKMTKTNFSFRISAILSG